MNRKVNKEVCERAHNAKSDKATKMGPVYYKNRSHLFF
ncbi:hypothetical protein JOD02_000523 [Caldicoprobacter guelmensis]|nr:hypothetical protein [Caldicoprobacter guelmensis]